MTAAAERIVGAALAWEGTPYRHQASRKNVGCDCLGLVRGVWQDVYGYAVETPKAYAADWAEASGEEAFIDAAHRHCTERVGEMQAGDLLLFRWRSNMPAKHAGILVAPDKFIHAYQGHAVTISSLVPQWRQRIAGIFQFPEG